MIILLVIIFCWILYRSGKVAALLEVFRLSPDAAPASTATTAPPEVFQDPPRMKQEPQPEPVKLETLERLQVENKAMIILKNKGIKEPLNLVKMYSDLELLEIIKEQ